MVTVQIGEADERLIGEIKLGSAGHSLQGQGVPAAVAVPSPSPR